MATIIGQDKLQHAIRKGKRRAVCTSKCLLRTWNMLVIIEIPTHLDHLPLDHTSQLEHTSQLPHTWIILVRKLLHTWIILVITEPHLVQIGRKDGPTEYLR